MPLKGFEQLAQELPDDERKGMLKDLKDIDLPANSDTLDSILDKKNTVQESYDNEVSSKYIEKIYNEVPVFEKIVMFFLKMFTKKSTETLVQEYVLKKLGREIEFGYPGIADVRSNKLKEPFYNEIVMLATTFEQFSETVNYANNKKNIANFYRYIASKEMAGFEEILKKNTNPENLFNAKGNLAKESESIKAGVARKFNEFIDSIEPDEKKVVYDMAKALFFIDKLVNFPFESLKKMFIFEHTGSRLCHFNNAKKLLLQLDSIVTSMTSEAIQFDKFFNYLYEYFLLNNKEFIASEKIDSASDFYVGMVKKGIKSVSAVNAFRKAVPLAKILKYIHKNISYAPAKISGGEEWFSIYKKMLKDESDEEIDVFLFNQKKKGTLSRLKEHITEISTTDSDFFTIEYRGKHLPLKKINSLHYLTVLHEKYYKEIIEPFASKFIIDGLFYKDTNKKELIEAFNLINRFSVEYNNFLNKLNNIDEDPNEQTVPNQEAASIKRKNSDSLIKTFTTEGLKLYKTYFNAFIAVKNVLGGILSGTHNVEYDTISNLPAICEEKSNMSIQNLDKFYRQYHDILTIISEYHDLMQQK